VQRPQKDRLTSLRCERKHAIQRKIDAEINGEDTHDHTSPPKICCCARARV
jgi:hypothetical protein